MYINEAMESGTAISRIVTTPNVANSLEIIKETAIANGLYEVEPKDGAYRRYDSQRNPSDNRGSFTYMDIFIQPNEDQIKIKFLSFTAYPYDKGEILAEIEKKIKETTN